MKKTKRILSVFLAAIMVISALPFSVTASAETTLNVGDVIEFGSYPQTEVTGTAYNGKTVALNDKVFAVEPIKWRVLNVSNGKALLLTEKVIDGKQFNESSTPVSGYKGNDYSHSEIREWLITDFYNTAFSNFEQNIVLQTQLESSSDNIFLLSKSEADNYANKYFATYATDYAYTTGICTEPGTDLQPQWWTRTAANSYYSVYYVQLKWGSWTTYYNWYDGCIPMIMGVRPAAYIDINEYTEHLEEKEKDENAESAKNYVQQHYEFVQSNKFLNLIENASFYETIWKYEEVDTNFGAYAAWEIIGDIGEVFTLSFNDLFVFDNPYEAILADVLSSCIAGENNTSSLSNILGSVFNVNSAYKDFMSVLRSSDNWDNSIKSSDVEDVIKEVFGKLEENLIQGVFVSPKDMNLKHKYPQIYDTLEKIWPDKTNAQWGKIFKGINNVSTVFDYFSTGTDIISCFFEAYQKYVIAQALVTTHQDLLNTILAAAKNMPEEAGKNLSEAINSYTDGINLDSAFLSVSEYMVSGSVLNAWNILKGSLENVIYRGIAKMLGITAVSSVNAAIIAYNTTYAILDSCSGVGGEADMFFLLNAAALFERALLKVTATDALNLINNKSLSGATKFDSSYGLLQALEQYTYHGLSKYISAMKQEFNFEFNMMSAVGGFVARYFATQKLNEKLSSADNAIASAVFFEGEWRNINCHTENAFSSKLVTVKCPTDVYVYDESNTLVMAIVNNAITRKTDNIAAIVDGDEKIFYLPEIGEYSIRIIGTDKGTMTYSVYDSAESVLTSFVEYETIPLIKDCEYEGNLVTEAENENSYILTLNKDIPCNHIDENKDLLCDFCEENINQQTEKPQNPDNESCSHICHTDNKFLKFIWTIFNFLMKLFSMERICTCGAAHY